MPDLPVLPDRPAGDAVEMIERPGAAFGDQYETYLQSKTETVDRPFSLARALKNKEHHTIAGLVVVAAIFAIKAVFSSR